MINRSGPSTKHCGMPHKKYGVQSYCGFSQGENSFKKENKSQQTGEYLIEIFITAKK